MAARTCWLISRDPSHCPGLQVLSSVLSRQLLIHLIMTKQLIFTLACLVSFVSLSAQNEGYEIGDQVADFSLQNVDGATVSLSDMSDQEGAIVIFTCNTCPYAVAYEERIISLGNKYQSAGWPVLAIQPNSPERSPGDSFDAMKTRAKEQGYGFPYLFDESQEVARTFGATRTPHIYLLQSTNEGFVVKYIGAIDDSPNDPESVNTRYVEEAIEALKAGNTVPRESTRAIGCTIKWAS